MKILIVYHCLIELGDPPKVLDNAVNIIREQMDALKSSGLLDAASEFIVGINGGDTSREIASLLIPSKAKIVMHGLQCRNECRTILELEKWLPGHDDWYVLYFHSKGCTHPAGDPLRTNWRNCSMNHLVRNWRRCVADLDRGNDAVGTHWMQPPRTPPTQYIFAGSMWWCKASFLLTLPSIMERARIKTSGLDALESRFEAEVILGHGSRLPRVKDYCPNWDFDRPHAA